MAAEHLGQLAVPAAMQLEILVIGLVVAGRIDVGDRPRATDLLDQLNVGRELLQLRIESGGVAGPIERDANAADFQPRTVDQPPGMRQAGGRHLMTEFDQVEIQALETVRQRQFDDVALAPGDTERAEIQIFKHALFLMITPPGNVAGAANKLFR